MIKAEDIPRRIILSRKGFDSSWGGCASPILDSEMISLPIPEHSINDRESWGDRCCSEKHLTYRDLVTPQGKKVAELVDQLTKGKVRPSDCVHLDPDIRPELRDMKCGKMPLTFGQDSGSQTELKELNEGDLFLFFGWFRKAQKNLAGSFCYSDDGADIHSIWGWLQIAEKLDLPSKLSKAQEIASHHPHVSHYGNRKNNCLYIAGKALDFLAETEGAGVFSEFKDGLCLTDLEQKTNPNRLRSNWRLPAFFRDIKVTHIPSLQIQGKWKENGESILGQAANHPGQEFVFNTKGHEEEVAKWLDGIFSGKRRREI